MPDDLDFILAATPSGVALAADFARAGIHPATLWQHVDRGRLVRIRRGCYVDSSRWTAASRDERYRLRILAAAATAEGPLVVSHRSAAAMHRLPSLSSWPRAVHTTDPDASGGRRGPGRVVHRSGPPSETVVIDGLVVTSLTRTLADLAVTSPMADAVAFLDAALRRTARAAVPGSRGRAAESLRATVAAELVAIDPFHGRRRAETSVAFADPYAENAGESLSRVRMWELGFEVPELQIRVDDVLGSFAVVDCYWRGIRRVGEFDGRMKYTRSRDISGLDVAEVVYREKLREDAIRRKGFEVTRWEWQTLQRPTVFAALLRDAGVPRR